MDYRTKKSENRRCVFTLIGSLVNAQKLKTKLLLEISLGKNVHLVLLLDRRTCYGLIPIKGMRLDVVKLV